MPTHPVGTDTLLPRVFRNAALTAILAVLATQTAHASENGTVAYPTGLYTQSAAMVPAPGTTSVFSFTNIFDADKLVGKDGKDTGQDFHATVIGQAFRVLHSWKGDIGGVHVSSGIAPVFVSSSVDARGRHFSTTDLRQIFLTPAALTFEKGKFHFLLSEDVFIPTGHQKPGNPSTVALGYFNLATMAAVTWNPTKQWDVSLWSSYNTTLKNRKTDYKTGDYVNFDYGLLYSLNPDGRKLALGVNGYFLKQISPDRKAGVEVPGGNKIEQFMFGPMVRWRFSKEFAVTAKWQHPVTVRNSAEGDRFWLQLALHLPNRN